MRTITIKIELTGEAEEYYRYGKDSHIVADIATRNIKKDMKPGTKFKVTLIKEQDGWHDAFTNPPPKDRTILVMSGENLHFKDVDLAKFDHDRNEFLMPYYASDGQPIGITPRHWHECPKQPSKEQTQ